MYRPVASLQRGDFGTSPLVTLSTTLAAEFKAIVGPEGYLDSPGDMVGFLTEWRGRYQGTTPCVLLPSTTAQVAAILQLCSRHRIAVVPQGGNTGLVGGGIPHSTPERPQVLVSTRRLNVIRGVDRDNFSITAEAGCVLAAVQAAAAQAGCLFPLSLAAEGSCQLGGNISTNAGGTAVLRFGNTRDLVLGLEVVLPDGRVLNGLRSLRKDNTGYDLKQLFIGAEGTLGVITAATCKLFPAPRGVVTAFVATPDIKTALRVFALARQELGDDLTAFEFANELSLQMVRKNIPDSPRPLPQSSPWYLLIEVSTPRDDPGLEGRVEDLLARLQETGLISQGVVASSGSQRAALWGLRHNISEAQRSEGASIKHDVAVPLACMDQFLRAATRAVEKLVPGVRVVAFGHLGDGNVHFNLSQPLGVDGAAFLECWNEVSHAVHELAIKFGGTFSAEHGIGSMKVAELAHWRGGVSMELMAAVKQAVDPLGIMNPGKLLPFKN